MKAGIDQDAIIEMFEQATAQQGEKIRQAVADATLKALQGRELSIENMRKVIKSMTEAVSAGAEKSPAGAVDAEALLRQAVDGMDAAMLQAVQAHRTALQQLVDQGAGLRESQLKPMVDGLEKMEDLFFTTIGKAVKGVDSPLKGPWEQVLKTLKVEGTATGAGAAQTVEQLMNQAQQALREGRARSLRASQALIDGYAALVSGVLIGMSEGMNAAKSGGKSEAKAAPAAKTAAAKKSARGAG